jgi:hydrogenase small subunit
VHRQARLLGAGGQLQRPKRGWMNGIGGCPNVGGICIGCTMPGFPDKFMPFMDEPPGASVSSRDRHVRPGDPRAARFTNTRQQGAEVAAPPPELTTGYDPLLTETATGARIAVLRERP